jgi:hypothetical protein
MRSPARRSVHRFIEAMGVDAVHRLAEAILDHETENQPFDVLTNFDVCTSSTTG